MNAEAIRKQLTCADIQELITRTSAEDSLHPRLTKMIGGIADGYGDKWREVVDIAPHASKIAEELIASALHHSQKRKDLHKEDFLRFTDAFSAPSLSSAEALSELDAEDAYLDPFLASGLGQKKPLPPQSQNLTDGDIIAKALAVAIDESLSSERMISRDNLLRLYPLMEDVSQVVEDEWYMHLDEHLGSLVGRAKLIGHSAAGAKARVCVEGVCRSGKAFQGQLPSNMIFALGATALGSMSENQKSTTRIPHESLFGAIAMYATFGFPVGWQEDECHTATLESCAPLQDFDRYDPAHKFHFIAHGIFPLRFSWNELESLALLTVDAACDRLEKMSQSPRLSEWAARRYSLLADSVRGASTEKDEYTSFARALGIQEVSPKENALLDGMHLSPAAPVGRRPATLVVKGRGNRLMRLHAAANNEGHLVGYMGHDPLSEEFHGYPEKYVYDLDGWRQGRMVDGIYRKGQPHVKMMTAPEGVELSPIKKTSLLR